MPPPNQFIDVADGNIHACARRASGTVFCRGYNDSGQVGQPSQINQIYLAPATLLPGPALQLAAGWKVTCILQSAGTVWCSGEGFRTSPTFMAKQIQGLADAVQISAGSGGGCAVRRTGEVACWKSATTLAAMPGLSDITYVTGTPMSGCAIDHPGKVYCWGGNQSGELGVGDAQPRLTPVMVNGLPEMTSVVLSLEHGCGVSRTGKVFCWGQNKAGALGNGNTNPSYFPLEVEGLTDVTALAVDNYAGDGMGDYSTCALKADRTVSCWGNLVGSTRPQQVPGLSDVVSISLGNYSCLEAARRDGPPLSLQKGKPLTPVEVRE